MPASQEADRRPVTVLFADLAGFTGLAETLDPEDVRALQSDLLEAAREVLEPLGAFIEKFIGDAVVAVFGAPTAHEDDPERALSAALGLHQAMEPLNARWAKRLGKPLALHIGVNTGRVVAGRLGAAYAVTGDAVNTAARLQSAAQAGQTLVSRTTRALACGFSFAPAHQVSLKGKSEPLEVYVLLGRAARADSGRGLQAYGLAAPLTGRERELSAIEAALCAALAGRAQVLGIVGEAGAGKSRLLAEFLARLQPGAPAAQVTVRQAACSSLGELPFGIIAKFVREGYGVAHDDDAEVARGKIGDGLRALGADEAQAREAVAMIGYVLGLKPGAGLHGIEPERLKRQILTTLRTALERRLAQGPLLLVVEDLHWADAASVEVLRTLADWLADQPLMLLFTARPDFDGSLAALKRATMTELHLAPLPQSDVAAILAAFFGRQASALPQPLQSQIAERSGGNPFYLEEIVRGLIAEGVLVRGAEGWACAAEHAALDVPPTLEGLLLSRIDQVAPEARSILQQAAVLGPVFDAELLDRVAGRERGRAALEMLRQAQVLEPLSETSWRFTHALVHEVAYNNLLQRTRSELHARTGRELEALHGPHPERIEDLVALGHHFSLSEDRARGARYLMAAGDWARDMYANDDALRHYRRALATLQECASCDTEVLAVNERLGDLFALAGEREKALEHHAFVRNAANAAGDAVREARAGRKLGAVHWEGGDRERGLACFRAALALLDVQADHVELAHLYQEMGRLAFRSGDNRGAVEWAERALAHAEHLAADERSGSRDAAAAVSQALNTLGVALARLNRTEEAVRHIERSVRIAGEQGLLQAACRGYANLGVLYATLDPTRAIDTCLTGLETAKRIGDVGFQSRLYANLAVAYCALTDRCDADGLRAAQAAIELDRKLGLLDHLAVPLIVLGQIHQCHGDPAASLGYYREALAIAEAIGEPQLLFPCYDGLATLCLDQGDIEQAEQHLRQAADIAERAGLDRDSLVVLPFLS
jgi:adenylate cyclase